MVKEHPLDWILWDSTTVGKIPAFLVYKFFSCGICYEVEDHSVSDRKMGNLSFESSFLSWIDVGHFGGIDNNEKEIFHMHNQDLLL